MIAFLDFEASSLADASYPIEVGWVFEDGRGEAYLIRPAPDWDDWDSEAEAIHGITRSELQDRGVDHAQVARRMIEALSGHDLCASAPSWDGKWLGRLLRAAGFPRHALRLRDTDAVLHEAAYAALRDVVPRDVLARTVADLIARCEIARAGPTPAHRALADAEEERQRWLAVCAAAGALAAGRSG